MDRSDQPRDPILAVQNLTVSYQQGKNWLPAIQNIDLKIYPGQTYGLVGESGSGKTTLALAIMRYLGENGRIDQGSLLLAGQDLCRLSQAELAGIWGQQLAMVPQDPMSSLNPSLRVGEQLAEALRHHQELDPEAASARVEELLEMVHIPDPRRIMDGYPHQLSGGMQQRVMIAMALSTEPLLLILDEPTTNLDVTTQAVVLDLIRELIRGRKTAALYVTHNLGVVANLCDRVAVLYAGELVEDTEAADLFHKPLHPYSQGLLDSIPRLGETKASIKLRAITGRIPSLGDKPAGCIFEPRCPVAVDICRQRPALLQISPTHSVRCHRWEEIQNGLVDPRQVPNAVDRYFSPSSSQEEVLLVSDLQVHFPLRRSLQEALQRQEPRKVEAVNGVDLEISRGETLGLVGESGSGKTTISRAVMGLVDNTGGEMQLLAFQLPSGMAGRELALLRHLQMVFQNPEEALNPYMTVGESLRRPLITLLGMSRTQADQEMRTMLRAVRLPEEYGGRLPSQLSGGEKQRVAIARAFASNPDLLIFDEAVSALDVSVQASILNLLSDLQAEHQTSQMFISHDLAVVGFAADHIAVIYLGQLMEVAPAEKLFEPPYHPYTEALLSAIPVVDPNADQEQIRLAGEIPSPTEIPSGCPFHTRCHRFLGDICIDEEPPWQEDADGRRIFCHIPLEDLLSAQREVFNFSNPPENGRTFASGNDETVLEP